MEKPPDWREMLLQYRLNELGLDQREEIDERLITDAEFADAMQQAEYDLLDAYAAGELSDEERLRVERALKPVGRFSPQSPTLVIGSKRDPARPVAATALARRLAWRRSAWLAVAAVLLVFVALAGGIWRARQPAAVDMARQPGTSAISAGVRSGSAIPAPVVAAPGVKAQALAPKPETVAMLVLPGALRSQAPLRLAIAAGVKSVHFVWLLSQHARRTDVYELQVVGEDGTPLCKSEGSLSKSDGRVMEFSCSASRIPGGNSFVRVLSRQAAQDDPPLLEVALTVTKSR